MSAPWPRLSLGLLVLALTSLALGYETNGVKWPGGVAHLRLDTQGFPVGSPESGALSGALEDWNQVSGSEFVFTHESVPNAGAQDHSDGQSGVDFSSAVQPSALAVTNWRSSGGLLVSADVLFRSSASTTVSSPATRRSWARCAATLGGFASSGPTTPPASGASTPASVEHPGASQHLAWTGPSAKAA